MLVQLGVDGQYVYELDFEDPFLQQSADFYRVKKIIVLSFFEISNSFLKTFIL